jgi:signal transduction histidine kinase/CheY-like chemotaxis protein
MMPDNAFIDTNEPIERQNERLLKITEALIRRVERDTDETGNAYSLFQRAVALEGEVRARTQDLQRTLDELSQANKKLEAATAIADEANRAKTRFLAAASHDVLQPLNAAKLFLGTLDSTDLDARQQRITGRLRTAFNSVEALLGALLDISKLDSIGATAEIATFSIAQILEPIAIEFSPLAAEKNIRFDVVPSSALVRSDPSHLRRIAQNLVSNAVRYCESGRVLIGCRRHQGTLRIEIHDTGPGIDADEIPNIFREFHRLEPSASESGQGMGLGLAIVDRACRLLNHPLTIASVPGKGSCFTVAVPMEQKGAEERSSAQPSQPRDQETLTGMIALVFGQDGARRDALTSAMEQWGASVIVVSDADTAIHTCEQLGLPPDVLLMVDPIPDADAFARLLSQIRGPYRSAVPAIVVSNDEQVAEDLGAISGVSFASLNQMHRLRALLTWNQSRADSHRASERLA